MSASTGQLIAAGAAGALAGAAVALLAGHFSSRSEPKRSTSGSKRVTLGGQEECNGDLPVLPKTPRMRPLPTPEDLKLHPYAVVIVDPVSTGANLANEIHRRGFPLIRVFSNYVPPNLAEFVAEGVLPPFVATIHHDEADFNKTLRTINNLPYTVLAVIAGSELGTELTDALGDKYGVRSNTSETSFFRRDKYQMGEAVRRSRVRAVKQARVSRWEQVEIWLRRQEIDPFEVVIKPIRSGGSDNVYLTKSVEELKSRFHQVLGAVNQLGTSNNALVVQEYLDGDEYVVDSVSRDGIHKLAAVWVYDKRLCNGSPFIYFGMSVVDPADPVVELLWSYTKHVLDALGVANGPAHAEVKLTKDGPCLVEMGARPHGAEGTFIPVADRSLGRNQVTMTADAYLDEKQFDAYTEIPERLLEFTAKVDLVSRVEGRLVAMPYLEEVKKLPTFFSADLLPKIGDIIPITIDCFTAVGSVSLVGSKAQVQEDYERIHQWENFFIVEPVDASAPRAPQPLVA